MNRRNPLLVASCLLIALGCFALTTAVLLPTYVYGRMATTPLDIRTTAIVQTPEGEGGEILDTRSITADGPLDVSSNVPLVVQRFVTVEEPSDADRVTFQAGSTIRRDDRPEEVGVVQASIHRLTVDRRTGDPVAPTGSIQTSADAPAREIEHDGLVYRFPFDTQKQDYRTFDLTALNSFDARFIGETTIDGLPVYHFQSVVEQYDTSLTTDSAINSITLPASKWGLEGGDAPVTMKRYYSNVRNIYIEPSSGVLVSTEENPYQYFARDPAVPEMTIFRASLRLTDDARAEQMAMGRDAADQLAWVTMRGPALAGTLGGFLVVGGIVFAVFAARAGRVDAGEERGVRREDRVGAGSR